MERYPRVLLPATSQAGYEFLYVIKKCECSKQRIKIYFLITCRFTSPSFALLRYKWNILIFELGLIAVQICLALLSCTSFRFFRFRLRVFNLGRILTSLVHGNKAKLKRPSLALLRCKSKFEMFELGLIAVQIFLALLPCTSVNHSLFQSHSYFIFISPMNFSNPCDRTMRG